MKVMVHGVTVGSDVASTVAVEVLAPEVAVAATVVFVRVEVGDTIVAVEATAVFVRVDVGGTSVCVGGAVGVLVRVAVATKGGVPVGVTLPPPVTVSQAALIGPQLWKPP